MQVWPGYFRESRLLLCFWFVFFTLLAQAQSKVDPTEPLFDEFYQQTERFADNPQQAIPALKAIQKKLTTISTPTLAAAELWHEFGLFYYGELASYPAALRCFTSAHAIRTKIITDLANNDLARSAFMIGVCQKYLGNYAAALTQVNQAIVISTKGKNNFMLAKEYLELGDVYDYLGDFDHSITYYERAYPHILKSPRDRATLLEDHFKRLAQAYLDKEEHTLALYKNRQAIRICMDSMNLDLADHFNAEIADCYTNMNLSFRALHQYDSAFICLQKAFVFYRKSNAGDAELQIGNVYNELGELHLAQNHYAEALLNQERSIAALKKFPTHHYLSSAYSSAAEVLLQSGKPNKALAYFRLALRVVSLPFHGSVTQIPTVSDKCLIALHGIARCQFEQQKYRLAFYNFRRLDTLIGQIRFSLREDGSKFSLSKLALPIYEKAIHTALLLGDTTAALDFCERNKAVVLRQALMDQDAKQQVPIASESQRLEMTLRSSMLYWQKKVLETEDAALRGVWQDSLAQAKSKFERYIQILERQYPEYHRLKYAQVSSQSIAAIQHTLPEATMCIEYFLGPSQLYIFAITPTNCRVFFQQLQPGFLDSLTLLIKLMRQNEPNGPTLSQISRLSYAAYQALLAPALLSVNNPHQFKRLRIIPDGILNYLAFEALLDAPSLDLKAQNAAFLVKKMAISYSFSNQLLQSKATFKRNASIRYGGFGLSYQQVNGNMAKLPLAVEQVLYLQKLLGGKVWIQGQATKQHFLSQAAHCRILHLSMHGVINEQYPAKSALLFAKESRIEQLSALEIYNMQLPYNELIVLSACNTGNGQLQRGEGIMSLSRAFTYAGCRSMVMSLWTLQDVYSNDIVKSFYAELKKGKPKDIALQQAKLQYLAQDGSERRAPNYWAAMVVNGDVEPILLNRINLFSWVIILILLIASSFFLYKYLKFRNL
jgi:CHAT domain-containing protein